MGQVKHSPKPTKPVTVKELMAAFDTLREVIERIWAQNRQLQQALKESEDDNSTIVVLREHE